MSNWTRVVSWVRENFAPPTFEDDEERTRTSALLHKLLWVAFFVTLLPSYFLVAESPDPSARLQVFIIITVFLLSIIGLLVMAYRGYVRQTGMSLSFLIWAVTTGTIVLFGGIRSTTTPGYLVAIFIAGLLLGWRAALGFGFLSGIAALVVMLCEEYSFRSSDFQIPVHPIQPGVGAGIDDLFLLWAIIIVVTLIVSLARRNLTQAIERARSGERTLAEANLELEARSEELQLRTRDLARRSMELQVAADISHDIATVRDLGELLDRAVNLIQDRFGFYYVAIFVVDDQDEYAVLRAATGEAGRQMLEQGLQIDLEEEGPISYVINSGYHRLLFDVGDDAVSFENPLLPETRSQVVLPLRVGRRIIGGLDIQCRRAEAFDGDDVAVLQSMADQLAVAIENAQLLSEMQKTLHQLEVVSGIYTEESWRTAVQRGGKGAGYRYRRMGIERVDEPSPEAVQAWAEGRSTVITHQVETTDNSQETWSTLAVPVKLRDQVVGVLNLGFEGPDVPSETVLLIEGVASRLALALENARLLDETRQRGQRDRLIADITAQVRASMDVERILQTAVRGLGAALGTERAFIRLGGVGGQLSKVGTGPLDSDALDNLPGEVGEQVDERAADEADESSVQEMDGQTP